MEESPNILFDKKKNPVYLDADFAMQLLEKYSEVYIWYVAMNRLRDQGKINRKELVNFFNIYNSFKRMLPEELSNYYAVKKLESRVETLSDLKEEWKIL